MFAALASRARECSVVAACVHNDGHSLRWSSHPNERVVRPQSLEHRSCRWVIISRRTQSPEHVLLQANVIVLCKIYAERRSWQPIVSVWNSRIDATTHRKQRYAQRKTNIDDHWRTGAG